jgi:hypothetical protein
LPESYVCHGEKRHSPKMAALCERPIVDRGGLCRAAGGGFWRRTADPIGAGAGVVLRPWEPSESLNLALIDMNDSYVGAVANGSAFYRDVPPGHYRIAPQSWARDFNQDRNVDLAPGQQLYVKIVSLVSWATGASGPKSFERDAFYAWLIPPEVAQVEIVRDRSGI